MLEYEKRMEIDGFTQSLFNLLLNVKLYKVNIKNKKEIAEVLQRFLTCPYIYNKEVNIFNKNAKQNLKSEYMFPPDICAASYRDTRRPDTAKIAKTLEANDYLFAAVASYDKADKQRLTLSSLGMIACDNTLALNPSGCKDEEKILKIIKYLES